MADAGMRHERQVDTVACPVIGETVTISVTFKRAGAAKKYLVDFACDMEGACGAPAWDPCPLYITYLEKSFVPKRI
ncbi:MAG: hypothetical protein ACE5EO_04535 [Candidatus Krumholzibacteriia bacterium]